ncbi:non-homologous end joining protein Ku [Streptomyces sp. OZ13]|uniref:non-homologous end joining protein Ku n=1 Tax=Streptomyces sp. OZ13 TaxID=3452210 RepID=UPI003F894968
MARAMWTGVLSFGLVTLPVGLFTATDDHTVHFHQLQRGTGDRIRNKRVNERTGREVKSEDVVKGYDMGDGQYVVVEPDELDDISPGRSKVVDISGFVDLADIEPVHFDRTYYLAPRGKEYFKVYELLRSALDRSRKAGIATLTMRGKEYLTAVRAQESVLVLHTMHYADEIRDPRQEFDLPRREKISPGELSTAEKLIEALSVEWKPEDYHDTYEDRVRELVASKLEGREVVAEAGPPEATNVVDLMEALHRSVERARSGEGRGGGSRSGAAKGRRAKGTKTKGAKGSKGAERPKAPGPAAARAPARRRTWPRSARRTSTPAPPTSASPAGPR